MSDLISRSDLYDQLANKLTWLMGYGDDLYLAVDSDIRDVIYNMPTAYSVDKVVEELEQLADESYKAFCIAFNSDDRAEYDAYTNAIEIVKQGDVSDDVCEWKLDGVYLHSPHKPLVSCVTDEGYRYYYCPVCGKKIKIVGD